MKCRFARSVASWESTGNWSTSWKLRHGKDFAGGWGRNSIGPADRPNPISIAASICFPAALFAAESYCAIDRDGMFMTAKHSKSRSTPAREADAVKRGLKMLRDEFDNRNSACPD